MNIYATGIFDKIVSAQRKNGFKYADATDSATVTPSPTSTSTASETVTPAPGTSTITSPLSVSTAPAPTTTPAQSQTAQSSTANSAELPRTILLNTLPVGIYNPEISLPRYVTNTPNMVNTPYEEGARGTGGGGGGGSIPDGPQDAVDKVKSKKGFLLWGLLIAAGIGIYYKVNN